MMRRTLLQQLRAHLPWDATEAAMITRTIRFVESYPNCFERTLGVGHVTASSWILDRERSHALLTHHRKLNKWLQLGGHCDGDPDVLAVALREAREESGLTTLHALSATLFDVDVHPIPARGAELQHFHYDIRFLFTADRREPLICSDESHALEWVPLAEVPSRSDSPSILRLLAKGQSGTW